MPNLPAHIDLAGRAAELLDGPALEQYLGAYILGSTAPDIRALTRGAREEYHFASLEFGSVGDGIEGLFEAHPELRSPACNDSTRAFVAGYITHLVLDEFWIVEFFRPYFGNRDVYADETDGLVLDRALQLELDRLSMEGLRRYPLTSPGSVQALNPSPQGEEARVSVLHAGTNGHVQVPFISRETLIEWQDFVLETVGRGFSWERLRFMARRIARGDADHPAHQIADEFLGAMPGSLETIFDHVSRDDLSEFRSRAIERMVHVVGHYFE